MNSDDSKNISVFSKDTQEALVSNKNIILYYHYLNNSFPAMENGKKFGEKLFRDEIEKKAFLDKNEWCSLEEFVAIVERAIHLTENFNLPRIVGALLTQYQKEYKLQEYKEAAKQNLKAFFLGPVELFKHISFFNYLFNQTKDIYFISGSNGKCVIKTKFRKNINPVFDYVSEKHIEGILESILDLFNLENKKIFSTLKEYDLKLLIEYQFQGLSGKCREKNNQLYLGDSQIAEKVNLLKNSKNGIYLGEYKRFSDPKSIWGYRITKNVYLDNKYLVLKKDEIYNAPYFITNITWNKHNFFKIASNLFQAKISKISPLGKDYAALIQKRQREEEEENKIRAERKKMEEEYYQLLLKDYIHPQFIKRAKMGPIPFKNIQASNIFVDINNSTHLRTKYGDEHFRISRNILLEIMKKHLHAASGEWAWINKIMGDGCYIVLGAYNYFRDRQDNEHIIQGLSFAINLQKEIKLLQKNNTSVFADFSIRLGMEAGIIELGEIYEKNVLANSEREYNFGNIRFFDTDGHPVNVAKRIESISKKIIKTEDRKEQDSGIFIGPKIMDYLKENKKNIKIKNINLAKIGFSIKDYSNIEEIGEIVLDSEN